MYRGALYINYVYMLKDFRRNKGISMRTKYPRTKPSTD